MLLNTLKHLCFLVIVASKKIDFNFIVLFYTLNQTKSPLLNFGSRKLYENFSLYHNISFLEIIRKNYWRKCEELQVEQYDCTLGFILETIGLRTTFLEVALHYHTVLPERRRILGNAFHAHGKCKF